MSNVGFNHHTYGCGSCGSPTITYPPVVPDCATCISAPTIRWGCDVGPGPGDTLSFSIPATASITVPAGHSYTYELYDFDQAGFNSVTVSSSGAVVGIMKNVYKKRKEYRIRYKIRQVGGIQSNTGEIFVCMQNLCKNCTGDCDQLTGDCAIMTSVSSVAECGLVWSQAVPNWNVNGIIFDEVPICFTNIAYDSGTKVLSATLLNYGCAIGVPLTIKMRGIKGSITKYQEMTVTIMDKSIGVTCPALQIANRCTGICEPVVIDLEVSDGQQQPDLSVS